MTSPLTERDFPKGSPLRSAVRWAQSDQSPVLAAIMLIEIERLRAALADAAAELAKFGHGPSAVLARRSISGGWPTAVCPGCSTDGSNAMGLQGHLPTCIYNPMRTDA